jgi:hypothetical protein
VGLPQFLQVARWHILASPFPTLGKSHFVEKGFVPTMFFLVSPACEFQGRSRDDLLLMVLMGDAISGFRRRSLGRRRSGRAIFDH